MLKTSKPKSVKLLKAVWYQSWTKGWAQVQIAGGTALGVIANLNGFIQNETFKSYLDVLEVPKMVYVGIAIFGIVALIAHGRSEE